MLVCAAKTKNLCLVMQLVSGALQFISEWKAHDLEAWMATFDKWQVWMNAKLHACLVLTEATLHCDDWHCLFNEVALPCVAAGVQTHGCW